MTGFIGSYSINEQIINLDSETLDDNHNGNEQGKQTVSEIPEGLSKGEWDHIQTELRKARYYPIWHESTESYVASNVKHEWGLTFKDGSAIVSPVSEED